MPTPEVKYKITAQDDTRKSLNSAGKGLEGLSSSFVATAAKVAALAASFAAITRVIGDMVDAYAKQEEANRKLTQAITATGRASEISADALYGLSSSLQKTTIYGDETITSMMSLLQSMANLDQNGIETITPKILDMASALNMDLNAAASLIAKTLDSDTNALGRYGIDIDMSADKTERLSQLTGVLTSKFGGMAEAVGGTVTGSIAKAKNAFGDLMETLGQAIWDTWGKNLTTQLTSFVNAAQAYISSKPIAIADESTINQRILKERIINELNMSQGVALSKIQDYYNQNQSILGIILEKHRNINKFNDNTFDILKGFKDLLTSGLDAVSKESKQYSIMGDHLKLINGELDRMLLLQTKSELMAAKTAGKIVLGHAVQGGSWGEEERRAPFSLQTSEMSGGGLNLPSPATGVLPTGILDALGGIVDIIGSLGNGFFKLMGSVSSVSALFNWQATILSGVMEILEPILNELLPPLIGILKIVGRVIGSILAPQLKALAPIISFIADAFVWLYNNAIRPLANAIIFVFNTIYNMAATIWNGIAGALNALLGWAGVHLKMMKVRKADEGFLEKITKEDLTEAGETTIAGVEAETGTGATYTGGRDIYVTVNIFSEVIMGDTGLRDLSLMIRNEILAAEALGL